MNRTSGIPPQQGASVPKLQAVTVDGVAVQSIPGAGAAAAVPPPPTPPSLSPSLSWYHPSPTAGYDLAATADYLAAAVNRLDEIGLQKKREQQQQQHHNVPQQETTQSDFNSSRYQELVMGRKTSSTPAAAAMVMAMAMGAPQGRGCTASTSTIHSKGVSSEVAAAAAGEKKNSCENSSRATIAPPSSLPSTPLPLPRQSPLEEHDHETRKRPPDDATEVATTEREAQATAETSPKSDVHPNFPHPCTMSTLSAAAAAAAAAINKRQRLNLPDDNSTPILKTPDNGGGDDKTEKATPSSSQAPPYSTTRAASAPATPRANSDEGGPTPPVDIAAGGQPPAGPVAVAGVSGEGRGSAMEGGTAAAPVGGGSSSSPSSAGAEQPRPAAGVRSGDILLHPHAIKA